METRLVVHEKDEPFLFQVYTSTREEELAQWGWGEQEKLTFLTMQFQLQQRSYQLQYPNAKNYILVQSDVPIGRKLVSKDTHAITLVDIAILPTYRNKGLGTTLLQDLQQEAQDLGIPLRLSVRPESPAKRLYERLGFQSVSRTDMNISMEWTS